MSSSTRATRFLLDENVRTELGAFLRDNDFDVKRLSKGAPDQSLATTSREERRVLVTNDRDFSSLPKEKLFSVVILRVPQRQVQALLAAFARLFAECSVWESQVIVLDSEQWKSSPLLPHRRESRMAS
jgi:predicted nuclease of predicted toxin-antitoxin system